MSTYLLEHIFGVNAKFGHSMQNGHHGLLHVALYQCSILRILYSTEASHVKYSVKPYLILMPVSQTINSMNMDSFTAVDSRQQSCLIPLDLKFNACNSNLSTSVKGTFNLLNLLQTTITEKKYFDGSLQFHFRFLQFILNFSCRTRRRRDVSRTGTTHSDCGKASSDSSFQSTQQYQIEWYQQQLYSPYR